MISRRLFTILLAASVALAAAPGCDDSPTAPSSVTVVAFGDSITAGVGTSGNNDYVSVLSNRTGVSIINAGRPGDTTASALARIDSAVLSRDADIVMVFLGGNDLLQGVPVQQRIANITAIVQQIRSDGAAVILIGVGSGALDAFEGALPGIASQTSSTLVPAVLDGIFGVPSLMADLIHPNNAGHAIIADRIEPALRAALAAVGS
ncbi:MAG: GDSL-type esterase/lipase family protein [Vicinamibacterales bacterium]